MISKDIDMGLYELMDRSHTIHDHFYEIVVDHDALDRYPELRKDVAEISDKLLSLYQHIGQIWFAEYGDMTRIRK